MQECVCILLYDYACMYSLAGDAKQRPWSIEYDHDEGENETERGNKCILGCVACFREVQLN